MAVVEDGSVTPAAGVDVDGDDYDLRGSGKRILVRCVGLGLIGGVRWGVRERGGVGGPSLGGEFWRVEVCRVDSSIGSRKQGIGREMGIGIGNGERGIK